MPVGDRHPGFLVSAAMARRNREEETGFRAADQNISEPQKRYPLLPEAL